MRNALTGRSDGSDAGGDHPIELGEDELADFMAYYDQSDYFCRKIIEKKVKRELGDDDSIGSIEDLNNDIEPDQMIEDDELIEP